MYQEFNVELPINIPNFKDMKLLSINLSRDENNITTLIADYRTIKITIKGITKVIQNIENDIVKVEFVFTKIISTSMESKERKR